jgi:hypothetical protein
MAVVTNLKEITPLRSFLIPVPQVPGLWINVSLEENGDRGSLAWEHETGAGDTEMVMRTWLTSESVRFLKESFGVK